MNFLLFTTCDAKGGRLPEIARLFKSLSDSVSGNANLGFKHYVLLQRCTKLPYELLQFAIAQRCFLFSPEMISLSRARNIMIEKAREDGAFDQQGLCAFPDDDAWYPPNILIALQSFFNTHPEVDLFACRYGAAPTNAYSSNPESINGLYISSNCAQFIRTTSSITIFLRIKLAASTGFFDERLGVGAVINGGEDLDYALRAFSLCKGKVALSAEKLIGHRDRTTEARGKYFAGSLFAIARSSHHNFCMRAQLLRKLLVGLYFLLRGEMKLGQYAAAVRVGLSGLGERMVLVNQGKSR
jgi:hypothetical protein